MSLSPELITFFSAMLPFVELKLAIPLGLKLGLSSTTTFIYGVSGSILPAALTLALVEPVFDLACKHSKPLRRFLHAIFKKTRRDHSKRFDRYGPLFLILFVAIPLPGSGTVSSALIAYLFAVDRWKALSFISIGAGVAGFLLIAGFASFSALIHLITG